MIYQIRIRGRISNQWSEWFQGLSILPADGGDTFLTGPLADQAALFGLLRKVRDLGLPLISVNRIPCDIRADPRNGGIDTTIIKQQEKGDKK